MHHNTSFCPLSLASELDSNVFLTLTTEGAEDPVLCRGTMTAIHSGHDIFPLSLPDFAVGQARSPFTSLPTLAIDAGNSK